MEHTDMRNVVPTLIFLTTLIFGSVLLKIDDVLAIDERPLVKIGLIAPVSGPMAEAGTAFRDAALMAIAEAKPTDKFRYQVIVEDDQLSSSKVALAAKKLIDIDRVDAMISTWSYGGTVVAPLAQRAQVIHFGVAWDPVVAKGSYNFMHLTPPSAFIPKFLEVFKRKVYKRIATIGMTESGSEFALDELERLTEGTEFQVVSREVFQFGETDFRTALARMEARKPDIYFINLGAAETDLLVRQLSELRIKTPITAITGFDVAQNLEQLEGRWYVSDSIMPQDFSEKFTKIYGHTRLYGVGNYYDSVRLIMNRFENVLGSTKPSRPELTNLFKSLDGFTSVFGAASIAHDGIITYPAQCRMVRASKRVTVPCETIN